MTSTEASFDLDEFSAVVESERERFEVPGLGVAVIAGGEVVLATGSGSRNVDEGLQVTGDTLFAIGSSTKAFTSSVIGTMVDEGLIEWDKPLRHYLPDFRMYDPVATEQLTIRDALSHRTGLPRHEFLWYDNLTITKADVVARLRYLEPNRSFRQLWQYNNLMYLTAGHLTEVLLGCTWEEAIRARLLDPLGMSSTCFSQAEMEKSPDHSRGYAEIKDELIEVPLPRDDSCAPAGVIKSSAGDMAAWVAVNVSKGEWNGKRVLSEAGLRELHAPTMVQPQGVKLWDDGPFSVAYALGWFIESYRGAKVIHHGGNIDGFSTQVAFLPDSASGVVVLTNRNGTTLRDALAFMALDRLLALAPIPWGERYHGLSQTMKGSAKEAKEHRRSSARDLQPSHPIEEYAGDYWHDGYGKFSVLLEEGELVPRYNELKVSLKHRHHDTWDAHLELFDSDIPVTFGTDHEGNVSTLTIPIEPTVTPIVFRRMPDADLSAPDRLAQLAGDYELSPYVLRVTVDRGALFAGIVGQRPAELIPYSGTKFRAKEAPAQTVEFVLDDDGNVKEVFASGLVFRPVTSES